MGEKSLGGSVCVRSAGEGKHEGDWVGEWGWGKMRGRKRLKNEVGGWERMSVYGRVCVCLCVCVCVTSLGFLPRGFLWEIPRGMSGGEGGTLRMSLAPLGDPPRGPSWRIPKAGFHFKGCHWRTLWRSPRRVPPPPGGFPWGTPPQGTPRYFQEFRSLRDSCLCRT